MVAGAQQVGRQGGVSGGASREQAMMSTDAMHMARALAIAERGRGRTSPNPMVGAVIVDDEGVVVGRGFHQAAGGPHAEIHALTNAGARARNATLYCTLEPCSHTGRTGPCAPRVAEAGLRRVVVAVQDPNPLVAGRGLTYLRERGLDVSVGTLQHEAERLNAPFFTVMRRRRPFLTLKVAVSRDGCVAAASGRRTQLTGPASNRWIHRDRAEVDALAVGSGTVRVDDPLLTPRGAFRARPLMRVVFDRSLRTPPGARMLSTLEVGPVVVVAAKPFDPDTHRRAEALTSAGVHVESVDDLGDFFPAALAALGNLGVSSVILEGGPTVHQAAWEAGVVDRVQIFRTPGFVGPGGVPCFLEPEVLVDHLTDRRTLSLGEDVLFEGDVHRAD